MRTLAAAGFSVDDIDYVMCTHLHVDHVGWNTRLVDGRWVPTFPNARYVFAKGEFDYWTEQNAKAEVPPFADSVLPLVEARRAEIVRDDFAIGDHARILPTPGHTPGHGDLMHSPLHPRAAACGERSPGEAQRSWAGEGGSPRADSLKQPLTPTLSPQVRGEGEETARFNRTGSACD
jgi:hypothetical protein